MITMLLKSLVPKAAGESCRPQTTAKPPLPCPDDLPCEKVAARAFQIWCDKGKPVGTDMENWLQAERELRAEYGLPSRG